ASSRRTAATGAWTRSSASSATAGSTATRTATRPCRTDSVTATARERALPRPLPHGRGDIHSQACWEGSVTGAADAVVRRGDGAEVVDAAVRAALALVRVDRAPRVAGRVEEDVTLAARVVDHGVGLDHVAARDG